MLQQQLAAMREAERSRPEKSAEKSAEAERDEAKAKAERLHAEVSSLRKKLAAAEKAAEAPSHTESVGSAGGAAAVRAALGGKPAQPGGLSAYLDSCGFDADSRSRLRSALEPGV